MKRVLLSIMLLFALGCTVEDSRWFAYWDQTTEFGFGSKEGETHPVKDGFIVTKSQLLEDYARSKFKLSDGTVCRFQRIENCGSTPVEGADFLCWELICGAPASVADDN